MIKDLNPDYIEKLLLPNKETAQFLKSTKHLNRHFIKEDVWMTNTRCSTSLNIKTTVKYHYYIP